jgi:ABC-2 type transport system ATP-binding protein
MLKIDKLKKIFGQTVAVDGVSLAVEPGEIVSLIGPNGSGKTTIIKTVAGLLQPTKGRVVVAGQDIKQDPVSAKAKIGYIPDEPAAWPVMTGREFLEISGALYGVPPAERARRLPRLLQMFDLAGIENGYFEDYSRGNKQKFAILAALLHRPELLLIDEPIVGLDPVSADRAEAEFAKFAAAGGAVLMVTHTLPVARKISHRIGILKAGQLVNIGSYRELCGLAKVDEGKGLEAVYKVLTK